MQQGQTTRQGTSFKGMWHLKRKPHCGVIAIGNAIGNSIVKGLSSERTLSAKEQAELDQKVAAVGRKELVKLDAKTRLQLQQSTEAIATDVGTRLASDGAAGFDAMTDALERTNDAMMDQYRNKRAEAAAQNAGMWQQTKADIAAIDTTVAANKQQRAMQAAQIQQRYANRAIDFRMANPAYRRPEPLFSYDSALAADNAMWGAGKQRAQGVRDGIAAGVDLIERSANAYGRAFEKAGDALVKSYENVKKFPDILQSGWDKALTLLPDSGGYTFALGVSGGYEAGFGAQGAKGDLVTIDFESKKVITASYWSAQGGSNVGIPAADVGAEFTYFRSERFRDIFEGTYNATGGQVASGVGVTVDKITTMPKIGDPIMHGWQATVGFGTPQADIHTHFGYGGIIKGTYQETKFSDIPANIWRHLWF